MSTSPNEYTSEDIARMRMTMEMQHESAFGRISRKCKEEPLVPAGVALTTFALVAATYGVKTGNRAYANNMFRLRVAAQSFTVVAMVGGSMYFQWKKDQEAKVAASSAVSAAARAAPALESTSLQEQN